LVTSLKKKDLTIMSQSNDQKERKETHETEQPPQPSWKGLYRVSAVLAIITGIISFVLMLGGATLYKSGYPSNATAYLQLVSQHQGLANGIWSLWMLSDFMGIAPTVATYLILRHYNKTMALVGSLIVGLYIFYDISVTELNSLTLVSLSQGYATATTDALRASYVAAATYGYTALPLQTVLSFAVGSIGWLLWCPPMAKSLFGRPTAIFGAVVNVIGIIGAAAPVISSTILGWLQFLAPPLIGLWSIVVGFKLYRHSSQFANLDDKTHPTGQAI
jgi:hypothetical protein